MKTCIQYFIGVTLAVFVQSCDKIEAPFRESSGGVIGTNDSVVVSGDTIVFPVDTTTAFKKVLVEDYTGHTCGNCPYAGVLLNDTLKQLYGNKLVIISVHAGFFAEPCPPHPSPPGAPAGSYATDFRNQTSLDWNTFFSVSSNPNGMIDRVGYPTTHLKTPDNWSTYLQSESILPADFKMRIINHFNSTDDTLKTAIHTTFLGDKTGTYKLQVVLTEDSLVDWQEWYPPHAIQNDPNYVHHHVLRGAINGSFGGVIASGTITGGTVKLNGYSFYVDPARNISHCKVVAFVYDVSNYKVLQVQEADVQ